MELRSQSSSNIKNLTPLAKNKKKRKKVYTWNDGEGRKLSAGGILLYDNDGIWVIGEDTSKGMIYTDLGGRYSPDDGDIYQTIIREALEESYYSIELTRRQFFTLINDPDTTRTYINGQNFNPIYICFVVHTDTAKRIGIVPDVADFEDGRSYVFKHNQEYEGMYRVIELRYVTFDEFNSGTIPCSYRLKTIVRHNPILKKYILPENLRGSGKQILSS